MKGDVEGELGIIDEVPDDGVVLAKDAIGGDKTKDFVSEIGHGSESFDFLIGEARGLKDGALNDFVRVADERTAGLGTAFDGELNALGDGHFGDLLKKGLTALNVGFRFGGGLGEMSHVGCSAMHFVQNIFLVGGDGRGMFESGGESEGIADAAEVFEQSLDADCGKMLDNGNEQIGWAILVLYERFADAWLIA